MMIIDPKTTSPTTKMPKASASTRVNRVRRAVDVQKEHQMNSHLCDGEHREQHRQTRRPYPMRHGGAKGCHGEHNRESEANHVALQIAGGISGVLSR